MRVFVRWYGREWQGESKLMPRVNLPFPFRLAYRAAVENREVRVSPKLAELHQEIYADQNQHRASPDQCGDLPSERIHDVTLAFPRNKERGLFAALHHYDRRMKVKAGRIDQAVLLFDCRCRLRNAGWLPFRL